MKEQGLPPQEITYAEVEFHFSWYYGDASDVQKVKLLVWRHLCQGYTNSGRACPCFATFEKEAKLEDYTKVIQSCLLAFTDVGGQEAALNLIVRDAS